MYEGGEILRPGTAEEYSIDFSLPEEFRVHMLVVGVIFYTEVNGSYYRLNNLRNAAADVWEVVVA
jgi:hypothetical protein